MVSTVQRNFNTIFPYGTLGVNLLGCFVIGMLSAWFAKMAPQSDLRLILMAGLLGGFTTFSAFGLETTSLLKSGYTGMAITYVAASVVLGITMVWAGSMIIRPA